MAKDVVEHIDHLDFTEVRKSKKNIVKIIPKSGLTNWHSPWMILAGCFGTLHQLIETRYESKTTLLVFQTS